VPHFRTLTEIAFELARRLPPQLEQGPVFFLAQSEKEVNQLRKLCRYFNDTFPEETIISQVFLDEHTLSQKDYEQHTLTVKPKLTATISHLSQQLTNMGFERFPRAVSARTFAVRGNIVDIVDQVAVRLEFDGNCVERLTSFNVFTQQSSGQLYHVTFYPKAYAKHIPLWQEEQLTYEFVTPKFYHKRFNILKQDAAKYLKIQIATRHSEQIVTLLPDITISTPLSGLDGFVFPAEHFLFLTDEHIFGEEEVLATFANSLNVDQLELGDYVVHIDHGIGIYEGRQQIDGEDYLKLKYLGSDKLFVPLSAANRVEKYIGQAQPKLTRLSGTQWETIVHRVQDDVRHTAKELLELHAQRNAAKASAVATTIGQEESAAAHDVNFALTTDQEQAVSDIIADLSSEKPMDRLLCGDVGFGKTEVALRAALHVVLQGSGQVAILAPTTVLADQHWHTFRDRLERYGLSVGCLSRLQTPKEIKQTTQAIQKGAIDIVIGTHRLLSTDIHFPKLQLVIIDEEQRFGVLHKERLKAMRAAAHVLTMTATPIPRTLNLALSGLRDISVLNTAPPQRLGVKTIINEFTPELELQAIQEELDRHGQVYLVHNDLSTIHAREVFVQQHFPTCTVAVGHGQLPADQLIQTMEQFYSGKIDVLIASTIIENGLDIANANTLIVEQAEDFGLAQLYQLRGRIGRSSTQGYAYLLYTKQHLTKQGQERLRALHNIKELGGGFELAMKDLEIRGVGDILGKKQHGHLQQIGLNLYTRLLHQAVQQLQEQS
jgi:transcription-repair coupling factor (superfamily II helicase)